MPGTPKRQAKLAARAKALEIATDEELRARGVIIDSDPVKTRIAMRAAIMKGEASSNERLHLLARAALWDVIETAEEPKDRVAAARYLADLTKPKTEVGDDIPKMPADQLEREAAEAERVLRGGGEQ